MDTATKTGVDDEKTGYKRLFQKTAEATRNLIGNKIVDKITSVGRTKSKEKEDETNTRQKSTYHQKKDSKLLMT